jgi:hypothetical protein
MFAFKSLICGAALAGLFEIYVNQVSRKGVAEVTSNLIALVLVFLVSNLLHWLAFRNPAQRTLVRKFAFSFGLWFSFFACWMVISVTMHRGLARDIDPTPLRVSSLLVSCVGMLGLPLALLNCFIANWSEPSRLPLQTPKSVRALVRKLTNSSAA